MSRIDRSLLWPTLAAVLIVAALCGLGVWQLQRLEQKSALIATATARLAAPTEPLPADLGAPEAMDFRRVEVQGTLAAERVLYRTGSSPAGRAGLRALAPLAVAGREHLLVDLGWLPINRKDEALALPSGPLVVEGVLRAPEPPAWLTPANDPAGNAWKWLDLPAMALALDVPRLAPMLLRAERIERPDGEPVLPELERGPIAVDLANDHLHYAITWFALAGGMVVIHLLFMTRHRRKKGPP